MSPYFLKNVHRTKRITQLTFTCSELAIETCSESTMKTPEQRY